MKKPIQKKSQASSFKILGICGSLRKNSFNRSILNFAVEHAPNNCNIESFEIGQLPFFNQDLESDPPKIVLEFREKISTSDALLMAVAEYNFSVSGVLKNAIEWASRPYSSAVLNHKPIAIMGASNGMLGTGRAQYHLRQMLVQTDSYVLNRPEVIIPFAQEKIDANGTITDEKTKQKILELISALEIWSKKFI